MKKEEKAKEYAEKRHPHALDVDAGYEVRGQWYSAEEGYIAGYIDAEQNMHLKINSCKDVLKGFVDLEESVKCKEIKDIDFQDHSFKYLDLIDKAKVIIDGDHEKENS